MKPALGITHIGKFYPPEHGGIESVTAALAQTHAAQGHRVSVVCFTSHSPKDSMEAGVRVIRCRARVTVASQPLAFRYFYQAFRQGRKADIVHVHAPNILAGLTVLFMGKKPKVLVHWHADISGKGMIGRVIRPLERWMLRRADAIICTTQAYADASLILRPFQAKLGVIPIGISEEPPLARPTAEVTELLSWANGRPLVLSVGRLVPYKGLKTLLAAAGALKTEAAFVVVGQGPQYDELCREATRLKLDDTVRFIGRQSSEVLEDLFARSTLFCLTSNDKAEAFGVVLLEAMRAGLPIVATNIPDSGVNWVNLHGVSGENTTPDDVAALAHTLDRILSDPGLLARYGRQARARYEQIFTQERMADAFLRVYSDLVDKNAKAEE